MREKKMFWNEKQIYKTPERRKGIKKRREKTKTRKIRLCVFISEQTFICIRQLIKRFFLNSDEFFSPFRYESVLFHRHECLQTKVDVSLFGMRWTFSAQWVLFFCALLFTHSQHTIKRHRHWGYFAWHNVCELKWVTNCKYNCRKTPILSKNFFTVRFFFFQLSVHVSQPTWILDN